MIYRELSRALPAIKDSAAVSVYTTQLVSFLIDEGRYADARALVDRSDLRYDKSTSPSVLSILSRLEWGEKNYGRVEELSKTLIADNDSRRRRSAAQYLMEISMMKHRPEEAIGYARQYVELTDSIERAETDGMISEQEDILNAYYVEGRNRGLDETIRGKETTITILYIVCGILALTAAALSYACFRIRRKDTVSRNDESSIVRDDIPAQGIATSAGLSRLRKAILQRHLDPDHTMGREDFEWLEKELDALLPGFADRLEALGLPERDFHDAMMIRLGMSTKDCSTILGISPAALSNSRKKLLARVSPEGHDKWADYIYAL